MKKNADLIIRNAEIYTIDGKGREITADAMAVKDGRIGYVGGEEGLADWESESIIDAEGKTVLPGMTDAHLHASATAEMLFSFNMYNLEILPADDRQTIIGKYQSLIKEHVENTRPGDWLRGTGWNPEVFMEFPEGQPTCSDLDAVCPDNPMVLRSFDHHFLWVNSKALEISGITKDTPTPRNGVVERDENGNPSGIFQETSAVELFLRSAEGSDYSVEEYKNGLRYYQKDWANKYGTTLIFDAMATKNALQAYRELAADNEFTIRVKGSLCADPSAPEHQFDDFIKLKNKSDVPGVYEIDTIKFFIDGSGFSFYMNEPFEKDVLEKTEFPADYKGYSQWDPEELKKAFTKLNAAGYQIHCHCMGDGAVRIALDAFEHAHRKLGELDCRNVITHIMNISEADIKRMADLKVIAAMQPMWSIMDSFMDLYAIPLLGKKRVENQYPIGSLKKGGVRITAGTDFPVTIPPNPFIGIQTGITRTVPLLAPMPDKYKKIPLGPSDEPLKNAVSYKDMIQSYTIEGAYQSFLEKETGSLETGKSADFIILDRRLSDSEVTEIEQAVVSSTYFRGKAVYTG